MDYKTCWELQQGLFDALVARKAACKGATKQAAAPLAANAGTAEASKASAREPAQRSAEAMPSKAGTQPGKGPESPTGSVSAAEGVEPSGVTGDGSASAGTILLVEHPPVYTLGKSGHAENLLRHRAEGGIEGMMTVGALAGASLARRLPAIWLRRLVVAVGAALSVIYFIKTYS